MFTIVNKPVAAAGPAEWLHGRQQSGAHELDVRPRLRGGRKRMTPRKRDGMEITRLAAREGYGGEMIQLPEA